MIGRPFLTIAIPTYNRKAALEETIDSILGQDAFDDRVELLVSDNCSTDGTEELLRGKYMASERRVAYVRRATNIGPDNNFREAIRDSSGRYVKLLNDNKPMLEGSLGRILSVLERESPTVLLTPNGTSRIADYRVTESVDDFVLAASYYTTWLGGICLERACWEAIPDKDRGNGKFLIQTYFLYDALVQAPRAVVYNERLFRTLPMEGSVGGYNLFQVFFENYLAMLEGLVSEGHLSRATFRLERRRLLTDFMLPSLVRLIVSPEKFAYDRHGWARIAFYNYWDEPLLYAAPIMLADKVARKQARLLATRLIPDERRKRLRAWRKLLRSRLREVAELPAILRAGEPAVLSTLDGKAASDPDRPICVFSSFDAGSRVREYVYHCLESLRDAGCGVVFVTTSERLEAEDAERLSELCVKIVHRENRGYDFYSWKAGLRCYPGYGSHVGLLFMNDSVIGPFEPFRAIFERIEASPFQLVGMTDSWRFSHHLQSYFLYLKHSETAARFLESFFGKLRPFRDKDVIIRKYEVGFSKAAERTLSLGALYSVEALRGRAPEATAQSLDEMNGPYYHWRELIEKFAFPFVKKSVITRKRAEPSEIAASVRVAGLFYDTNLFALGD
jgi:glycosyltransferase involved in cell wall biosynthesis